MKKDSEAILRVKMTGGIEERAGGKVRMTAVQPLSVLFTRIRTYVRTYIRIRIHTYPYPYVIRTFYPALSTIPPVIFHPPQAPLFIRGGFFSQLRE